MPGTQLRLIIAMFACGLSVDAIAAPAAPRTLPAWWPSQVPAEFVATPNGFFHPSCVVTVGGDEALGRDLMIRASDGTARRTVAPCAYPRFSANGRLLASPDSRYRSLVEPTAFYDGWLVSYWYDSANLASGTTVTGKWVVPASPIGDPTTGTKAVTLFYFNDVEMEASSTDIEILQPVLGFGQQNVQGWTIASWNCCTTGIEATSATVAVTPGDVIEGVTAGTNCDSSGVCQNWTVTTTDVTTGKSTVLNTTDPDVPNVLNPAVVETYGVTACKMFAPGGVETFFDNNITKSGGAPQPLSYTVQVGPNSGSPSCGYAGNQSGSTFNLIYSTSPNNTATTTALSASPTTIGIGGSVALTATVTAGTAPGARGGSVVFLDGATQLGEADATNTPGAASATATRNVSTLSGGSHSLTAQFNGDNGFQPSTSSALSFMVTKWPTTTALVATPSDVSEGMASVLTATVSSGAPATVAAMTGAVQFSSGTTVLASVPVSATAGMPGTATFDASALRVGADSLSATYEGDTNYNESSSTADTVEVTSTLALSPTSAHAPPLGSLAFTASGGIAPFQWMLTTNASHGSIDASTGTYVAGSTPGVSDVVKVTDSAGAVAATTVTVGPGVAITPATASVQASHSLTFGASGGSDTGFVWALATNGSGGSIDPSSGAYKAGTEGNSMDVVTATDSLGNSGSANISVGAAGATGGQPVSDGGTGASGSTSHNSAGCQCGTGLNSAAGFDSVALLLAGIAATIRVRRRQTL